MTVPAPESRPGEAKPEIINTPEDNITPMRREPGPMMTISKDARPKNGYDSSAFLSAPMHGPIRPLSPDTLSNLSVDDYDQIRAADPIPVPRNHHPQQRQSSRTWRSRIVASWIRNKGLALMLMAQIFGCLMNVTTRLLEIEGNKGKGLHPFQILFARMGITFVLASTYMWWTKTPHFPFGRRDVRLLLACRGFGGFFGVFGMYYSLLYLPLADATVITFLAPALACWACSILIKEPFTRLEKICGLVSLVGVVLIARPVSLFAAFSAQGPEESNQAANTTTPSSPDAGSYESVTPTQRLFAVGIALVGVLGAASAYTTIRWIGKRAHPLISVNYFAGWCFLVSIVMQAVLPDVGFLLPADLKEWGYLLFLGTCGFIMQFLLAAALSYEKSSRVTNIVYTQMLFALGFDKLVFGHSPNLMSIFGSSLILGSAIFVAMQKSVGETGTKESSRVAAEPGDEESARGLMDDQEGERLPVQEVQLRTLR